MTIICPKIVFCQRQTLKHVAKHWKHVLKSSRYDIITCEKASSYREVYFALKCVFSIGWLTLLSLMTQSLHWYNWLNSRKHLERGQELISSLVCHYLIISRTLCHTLYSWLVKWYIYNIIKSKDKRCAFRYPVMALILKIVSEKGPSKSK